MGRFIYQARDSQGQSASGVLVAPSLQEAGAMLRSEGKYIIRLTETDETQIAQVQPAAHSPSVKKQDVIVFAHQLAVMVDTGVPLSEALECAADQASNPDFKKVLQEVTSQVQAGCEFSTALRRHSKVFPVIMTSLIRASEISGTMGIMLERTAGYMAKEQQILRQARGALYYPMFMVVIAIAVMMFLMTFVLPRFAAIYEGRQAALPAPTQLLLNMSSLLVEGWSIWVTGLVVLTAAWYMTRRIPAMEALVDATVLKIPIMGRLVRQLHLTRACRTMATMLSAGVSMLDMVAIVRQVTPNQKFQQLWDEVDERLRRGEQLSATLFESNLIPRSISQMVYSGERSGRLSKVLDRIADFTEAEFDSVVKTSTQFIEPVMVVVMGSVVGFIAIALLMPIFTMGKVVAGG